jgi:hypothetical protein
MITVWAARIRPGDLVDEYEDCGAIVTVARDWPSRLPKWMRSTEAITTSGETTMINVAELNRVLAHCEAHPRQHDQNAWLNLADPAWDGEGEHLADDWQCHTTACLAGWTVILNGWKPNAVDSSAVINVDTGVTGFVATVARRILGLSADQAHELFTHTATLTDVRRCVKRLLDEESATP